MMDLIHVTTIASKYYFVDKQDATKWYYYDAVEMKFTRCTFENFDEELFTI